MYCYICLNIFWLACILLVWVHINTWINVCIQLLRNKTKALPRCYQSCGLGKLGHQGAICWLKKELSWRNGTFQFFFCQDRKLKPHKISACWDNFFPIEKMLSEWAELLWDFQTSFIPKKHEVYHFSRIVLFSTDRCCIVSQLS